MSGNVVPGRERSRAPVVSGTPGSDVGRLSERRSARPNNSEKSDPLHEEGRTNHGRRHADVVRRGRARDLGGSTLPREGANGLTVPIIVMRSTLCVGRLDVDGLRHTARLENRIRNREGCRCAELRDEKRE